MNPPSTYKRPPLNHNNNQAKMAGLIDRMIKSVIGGLIGVILAGLFGVVILAFIVKAFLSTDEISYQLLNTAVTLVSALLGAVLGYLLGKNSSR